MHSCSLTFLLSSCCICTLSTQNLDIHIHDIVYIYAFMLAHFSAEFVLHLYKKLVRKDRMKTWLLYYTRTKQTWQPPLNKREHEYLRNRCNVRRAANGNTRTDSLRPSGKTTVPAERARPENGSHESWPNVVSGSRVHSNSCVRKGRTGIDNFLYFRFPYQRFPVFPFFVSNVSRCIRDRK